MGEKAMEVMLRSLEAPLAHRAVVLHDQPGSVVRVHGPISTRTSETVRGELRTALACGEGDLRLDLAGAQVWDATGLGVLVGAHHRATRCGRRLIVVGATGATRRVLTRGRLDRVLHLTDAPTPPLAASA